MRDPGELPDVVATWGELTDAVRTGVTPGTGFHGRHASRRITAVVPTDDRFQVLEGRLAEEG